MVIREIANRVGCSYDTALIFLLTYTLKLEQLAGGGFRGTRGILERLKDLR